MTSTNEPTHPSLSDGMAVRFDRSATYWPLRVAADWIALGGVDGSIALNMRDEAATVLFLAIDDGLVVEGLWGTEKDGKWTQTSKTFEPVLLNFSRASVDPEDYHNNDAHWVCWETLGDEVDGDVAYPLHDWPSYWTNLRVPSQAVTARWPEHSNAGGDTGSSTVQRRARVASPQQQALTAFIVEELEGRWPHQSDERISFLLAEWLKKPEVYARFQRYFIGETTIRNFRQRHGLGPGRALAEAHNLR